MKNMNVIALAVLLFAGVTSASDKPNTQKTEPGLISKAVSAVTGAVSSACASLKATSSTALKAAVDHPFYTAAGVAAVGGALYVIAKNWKQIKRAILNNPKTSIACALGTVGALYAYSKGYVKLPSFGSKATDTKVDVKVENPGK